MNNSYLNKNLECLRRNHPSVFSMVKPLKPSKAYQITPSKNGPLTILKIDQEGRKKQLYSQYDPHKEVCQFLEGLKIKDSINFIILGFGLGYHSIEIVKNVSKHANICIFEKDPELFALAIREIDLSMIFEHSGVRFFLDIDPLNARNLLKPEQTNFILNNYCLVGTKAIVKTNQVYYDNLMQELDAYFKEIRMNLKTLTVQSKLYYKNIFSNLKKLLFSPGIHHLKNSLNDVPAIVCSAGPSLDKNIQFLKTAKNNFF